MCSVLTTRIILNIRIAARRGEQMTELHTGFHDSGRAPTLMPMSFCPASQPHVTELRMVDLNDDSDDEDPTLLGMV